jgi:RNA polymerase sigma factor (sigma-70 family)
MGATNADIEQVAPMIRRMLGARFEGKGHVEVDDLYQEAMLQVCKSAHRWEPARGAFSTFAGHRALGAALDYLRKERPGSRGRPALFPLSLDEQWIDGSEDGEPATIADFIPVDDPKPVDDRWLARLYAEVDKLPERQARIVRFYAEGDMTLREIADLEGVTESRISQLLTVARQTLKPRLIALGCVPNG